MKSTEGDCCNVNSKKSFLSNNIRSSCDGLTELSFACFLSQSRTTNTPMKTTFRSTTISTSHSFESSNPNLPKIKRCSQSHIDNTTFLLNNFFFSLFYFSIFCIFVYFLFILFISCLFCLFPVYFVYFLFILFISCLFCLFPVYFIFCLFCLFPVYFVYFLFILFFFCFFFV